MYPIIPPEMLAVMHIQADAAAKAQIFQENQIIAKCNDKKPMTHESTCSTTNSECTSINPQNQNSSNEHSTENNNLGKPFEGTIARQVLATNFLRENTTLGIFLWFVPSK